MVTYSTEQKDLLAHDFELQDNALVTSMTRAPLGKMEVAQYSKGWKGFANVDETAQMIDKVSVLVEAAKVEQMLEDVMVIVEEVSVEYVKACQQHWVTAV